MGLPSQTAQMRRYYDQSEWIEQQRLDRKAFKTLLLAGLGVMASMAGLYTFLLFALL